MADFIAENFIIIVIVVGGILSLLKNKSIPTDDGKEQKAENPNIANSTRRDRPATSHGRNTSMDRTHTRSSSSNSLETVSVGDQQQRQMKELEKRIGASSMALVQEQNEKPHDAGLGHTLRKPKVIKPYEQDQFKREIKGKLNQRGLIDSIVMAEVLGPPRAKEPYSSIISRKR